MNIDTSCGDTLDIAYDAAVDSGDFVVIGEGIFGFAVIDGDATADGYTLKREGVFYGVTKATGAAWAVGDRLGHDGTAFTRDAQYARVAVAVTAAASGATTGDVLLLESANGDLVIAGGTPTAVTASATETVTQTATIPAGILRAGDEVEVDAGVTATTTTGTETVRAVARIGGLTGVVVADAPALDVANGDRAGLMGKAFVDAVGASGSIGAHGVGGWSTAGGAAKMTDTAPGTVDTTAAVTVVTTVTNSSTGESCIGNRLKVRIKRAR